LVAGDLSDDLRTDSDVCSKTPEILARVPECHAILYLDATLDRAHESTVVEAVDAEEHVVAARVVVPVGGQGPACPPEGALDEFRLPWDGAHGIRTHRVLDQAASRTVVFTCHGQIPMWCRIPANPDYVCAFSNENVSGKTAALKAIFGEIPTAPLPFTIRGRIPEARVYERPDSQVQLDQLRRSLPVQQ